MNGNVVVRNIGIGNRSAGAGPSLRKTVNGNILSGHSPVLEPGNAYWIQGPCDRKYNSTKYRGAMAYVR
jgi:hypothetical protein